jgi:hypothetical protein
MPFRFTLQRGPFLFTNGSRFCFCLLLIPSFLYSQNDSTVDVVITAGSNYFDVFRQKSDKSNTTILVRESFAEVSARQGKDSLTLTASSSEEYAGFSMPTSQFSASLHNSLQTLKCSYSSKLTFVQYSLAAGMVMNASSHPLYYKAALTASPFEEVLWLTLGLERLPYRYGFSVSYYDFQVPFDDAAHSTLASFTLRSKPFASLLASLAYCEADGGSSPSTTEYGIGSSDRYFGKKIFAQYFLSLTSNVTAEFSTEEFRSDVVFNRDGQLFGDLTRGLAKHSRYVVRGSADQFNLPITLEYAFDQLSSSGTGHFESWPFTSLVSSIITNRLLYQFNGFLKVHSLRSTAKLEVLSMPTNFEISYHRILTDIVLENWQPEFLAFGMKNYASNPFSIKDIQLLKLGIETTILTRLAEITAQIEQYVPIAITYRRQESVSVLPGEPPAPASTPQTDGGRRFGLRMKIPL